MHNRIYLWLFCSLILLSAIGFFWWSNLSKQQRFLNEGQGNSTIHPTVRFIERLQQDPRPEIYRSYDFKAICEYEWEKIAAYRYFRRDSAYYMIDLKTINLLFVGAKDIRNDFEYNVSISIDGRPAGSALIKGNKDWFLWLDRQLDICFYKIQVPFDLLAHVSINDETYLDALIRANRIALKLHVFDDYMMKGTQNELDLVLKYMHKESLKKHSAMICSKSYICSKKSVKDFEWWIEINKRIGYEKISIVNNSLEYSASGNDGFEALFKKYAGYVEVVQMNCMPHYFTNGSASNGRPYVSPFAHLEVFLFEVLAMNMCYLRHAQDYRHIAVMDVDEIFMPPLIQDQFYLHDNFDYVRKLLLHRQKDVTRAFDGLMCNRYSSPQSDLSSSDGKQAYTNKVELFVKDVARRESNYKDPQTLCFEQGWQLTTQSVAKILAKFDDYFNNAAGFNPFLSEHIIEIADESLLDRKGRVTAFRFKITGQDEVDYAKNLVRVFNLYVQPFLRTMAPKFSNVSSIYTRFFFLASGAHQQFDWGKSIHNTMSSRFVTHHFDYWTHRHLYVNRDFGQMHHFRSVYYTPLTGTLSVRQLSFDYNYLKCFFIPVFSDLIK